MRVMTMNIWNYNRHWTTRRRLIAELIRSQQPDVVALQETRHDFRFERGRGQGDQLADLTGYYATSATAQVYFPVPRIDEGLTTLTRQPPRSVEVCRLTLHPHDRQDENRRICLAVAIEQDAGIAHVFNTHFSLSARARITNAMEVSAFVERRARRAAAVLMGDLNAEPDAPEIRFLVGEGALDGMEARFTDCWDSQADSMPGYTYASFDPVRRIDYILARNLSGVPDAGQVVGSESAGGIYASDHLGIVVDLPM